MGIYIKGMEMPMNCCRCPCADLEYYDCNLMPGTGISSDRKSGKRHEDCPLVPVPPHGRLVDLDRILEIIDGIWDCNDMTFKPNDHCCDIPKDCHGCKWAETKRAIREIVANAPTIIPASEEGE